MPLALPILIPFAELAGISIGTLAGIAGLDLLSKKVESYIENNPENAQKIFNIIMPGQGIAALFKNESGGEDIEYDDFGEEITKTKEEPKLTGKEKSEKIKAAIKRARAGRGNYSSPDAEGPAVDIRGSVIREVEDMGIADKDLKDNYDPNKKKFNWKRFTRNKADGGGVGSMMQPKRGLVNEPGGYAGLTKQQSALLNLQLQNDPEFKTGLYESEPVFNDYSFEQMFNAPTGPLYNVTESPNSDSYFDESLHNYRVSEPRGPLHSVDEDRTIGMIESLNPDVLEKMLPTINFNEDGSMYQTVDTNAAPKGAEFRPKDLDLTKRMQIGTNQDNRTYGYTKGPTLDRDNLPQTGKINLNPDLAKFLTTEPTSPRNEQLIDSGLFHHGMQKPVDLMNFATDVVQHEYGHNVLDLPGFEDIRKSGIEAGIPSNFQLKGQVRDSLSDYDKEELFNRAIDIERYYNKHNKFGITGNNNIAYMTNKLQQKYKNLNDGGQSMGIQYLNSLRPQVKKYFNEVDRQGNMSYINKQKLRRGMPQNLGDAGQSLNNMSGVNRSNRNPNQGNTQTGFGKSGMGRDPRDRMADGGMAGDKTYHQYHDQYVPMDLEGIMGYAHGGDIQNLIRSLEPARNGGMMGVGSMFVNKR